MKLEHSFTLYTKINSKWFKDLNIRHDTIKLLEENKDKILSDINRTNVFLGQSPKTKEIKAKISRWDLIQLLYSKENYKQNEKTTYRMGENICKWCDWERLNFQNIQRARTTQYPKKQTTQSKIAEDLNKHFSKEDT